MAVAPIDCGYVPDRVPPSLSWPSLVKPESFRSFFFFFASYMCMSMNLLISSSSASCFS